MMILKKYGSWNVILIYWKQAAPEFLLQAMYVPVP